ncbi:MAG: histidine phosphatase family protein [Burkholderiaceae bacterium]
MTIILVRHGETALNISRVLQPADTPLSANGLVQARAVAQRLAGDRVGAIVSSDLPRALVTAQAIGTACRLDVSTSTLLRERDFGDWRGLSYDALGIDPMTMDEAPPAGESMADFERRVALAFDFILRKRHSLAAPLVVVSHGMLIRAMLERHCAPAAALPPRFGNTALSIVDAQAPHAARLLACTAHLDEGNADAAAALAGG